MHLIDFSLNVLHGNPVALFLSFYIIVSVSRVLSVSFEEDTRLTATEAEALAKFRDRVIRILPHKYMEESIFLVRWLRARNFDLVRAEEMLLQNLQWRTNNKIDTIDDENWQEFEYDYPWNLDGVDKEGRPSVQIALRDWDIRQAVISGRRERLVKWIYKYFEDATKLVRKLQKDGKNVTQFNLLLDAEEFNVVNHGCPLCMSIYLTISSASEEQYPGSINKIHVINTPEFFNVVLRVVWPLLSQNTKNALKVQGTDRQAWKKVLNQDIEDNQLLPTFGGTLNATNSS